MKIAKEFRWEMGHRLPEHTGLCKNIHGHSYKCIVELEGAVNEEGMIIDFYDLGAIVKPIIDRLDHSFLCQENDTIVREFLEKNNMKIFLVDYLSTVENISKNLLDEIIEGIRKLEIKNVHRVTLKIFETPNSYAESTKEVIY
ncbi:MAG TPA: 6-carboxytetrahydropterin synthase [Ignavibacteria bacterium]|nr:6-carboxytetrahydropterin synthase [Ignavibacteria bacterium]